MRQIIKRKKKTGRSSAPGTGRVRGCTFQLCFPFLIDTSNRLRVSSRITSREELGLDPVIRSVPKGKGTMPGQILQLEDHIGCGHRRPIFASRPRILGLAHALAHPYPMSISVCTCWMVVTPRWAIASSCPKVAYSPLAQSENQIPYIQCAKRWVLSVEIYKDSGSIQRKWPLNQK